MKNIKFELKYCEGCGTLKLRPVVAAASHCRVCESMLTRFRFPRARMAQHLAKVANLPESEIATRQRAMADGRAAGRAS